MNEKTKAIIGYIIPIAAIIFLAQKETPKNTKFHCAQSIVILIAYIILSIMLGVIAGITGNGLISKLAYIAWIVFVILGIVKANNEENPELPLVGDIAKSIFGKAIGE